MYMGAADLKTVEALQEFDILEEKKEILGLVQLGSNFVTAVVRHAADGFTKASPEVQGERMRICRACPLFEAKSERWQPSGLRVLVLQKNSLVERGVPRRAVAIVRVTA